MQFRNRFFRQKNSDKTSPYQKSISKLQDSSVWVERFHFLIEKFPDSMKSLGGKYHDIVTNIKTLGEKVFVYLQEHDTENCSCFQTLRSIDPPISRKRTAADKKIRMALFFDDVKNRSPDKLQELEQELEQKRQRSDRFFAGLKDRTNNTPKNTDETVASPPKPHSPKSRT